MRRTIPFAFLCLILLLVGSSAFAVAHRVELSPPTLDVDGSLTLDDAFDVEGLDAPVRILRLEIGSDEVVTGVEVAPIDEASLPVASFRRGSREIELTLGQASGESAGYRYWVLPEGDYRGHRIAHVALLPIRSESGAQHFLRAADVSLQTRRVESSATARRIDHPRTSASDRRALRSLLDAEPLPEVPSVEGRSVPPELSTDTVEYVVITPQSLEAAFQEIADFKTREGIPAIVTTVEWILANYDGNDSASRIRAYVRDLYLYSGLRYVLLGGDTDEVPTRVVTNLFTVNAGIATDKYFGCLDGSWNADGDSELGEAPDQGMGEPGDSVDLYPEVSVGRIPVSTPSSATDFIQKWKSYTGYDPANFRNDYQNKFLALGEVLFPTDWEPDDPPGEITSDGAAICESTITYLPPAFQTRRLYQYWQNPETPGAEPESRDSAIARINEGFGIIDHVGHGFRTIMSVGEGKIENKDADEFTNTNAYSLLYAVNCTSGAIRFDCIVEHMLTNPMGGAVAAIASTDLDFPDASERFKYEFFREVFTDGNTTLSDAFQEADLPFVPTSQLSDNSFRWTYMTLIALGDPAMEIWRAAPDSLDLAFAPTMDLGDGSFTVTVTDDGSPVEDARVTLYKSDGYGIATTDAGGVATVDFLPETAGSFQITAVKNSYVPAIDNATINAPVTAALRVDSMVFHDGTGGGGTGNGDNRPDAGESIVVDVTLRNDGSATATGITTTFHANNGFLTVTDSTEVSTDILAAGTNTLVGAYAFDVSAALPDTLRHVVVEATTDLVSNEGSWTEETPFSIYQRILDLIALDWSISGDDGDGVLEAGETAEILLTVHNRGEAEAVSVVGVGSYTGGLFTFLDDTINFGNLAGGGLVQGGPLRLLSTGGGEADLTIGFNVSDGAQTDILVRPVDVIAPAVPGTLGGTSTESSVRLTWSPPADADLNGYRVYRSSTANGVYSEVTGDIVPDGAFFANVDLPPLTAFWYRVASIDSSGNESAQSDSVRLSTSPPILEGWPVPLPSGESKGSPTFADVDFNGAYELVFGWSYPMILLPNGGDYVDGDRDPLTTGIFDDWESGASKFYNSPAVWDLDDDGVMEIIFSAWQTTGNGMLIVYDATGAIEPGWPQTVGIQPWSTPAVGDIDGDGDYEIFCSSGSANDDFSGVLFGFHHDGSEIIDGDNDGSTHGYFYRSTAPQSNFLYSSPALADIDGDMMDEIVYLEKSTHTVPTAGNIRVFDADGSLLPGFPYGVGSMTGSTSSPAVADLDDNGDLEIVAVTENQVIVINHDGTNFIGWPKSIPAPSMGAQDVRDFMSSPAIADIDGDGNLDVVVGWLSGTVYAWRGIAAATIPGFPATVPVSGGEFEQYLHTPVIGNIDGDPDPEILVPSGTDELHALNEDGTVVDGFPLALAGTAYGSAAIWDLDLDGNVNVMVQTTAPSIQVFDFPNVPFLPAEQPWPMFRHNQRKDGEYTAPITVSTQDPASVPTASAVAAPYPNPFLPRVTIPFVVGGGEQGAVRIRVFDVGGREVRRLADGRFPAGRYEVRWDGRTERGTALAAGIYFVRTEIGTETFVRKVTLVR